MLPLCERGGWGARGAAGAPEMKKKMDALAAEIAARLRGEAQGAGAGLVELLPLGDLSQYLLSKLQARRFRPGPSGFQSHAVAARALRAAAFVLQPRPRRGPGCFVLATCSVLGATLHRSLRAAAAASQWYWLLWAIKKNVVCCVLGATVHRGIRAAARRPAAASRGPLEAGGGLSGCGPLLFSAI